MNYADIKKVDVANGPGVRVSLFVSGCTHRCEECFNPEAWDFGYGAPFGEAEMEKILALLAPDHIRGLSLLGGEPFEPDNQAPVLELVRRLNAQGRTVLMVLHDLSLAFGYSDYVALVDRGELRAFGRARAVFESGAAEAAFGVKAACLPVEGKERYLFFH